MSLPASCHLVYYRLNLELYAVADVMSSDVVTLHETESVRKIAEILLNTTHSGFPVTRMVSSSNPTSDVFVGTITRYYITHFYPLPSTHHSPRLFFVLNGLISTADLNSSFFSKIGHHL